MKPVTLAIVGGGGRGTGYARYAKQHGNEAQVVAVAEPRAFYRDRIAGEHGISGAGVFDTWQALAERPRLADAAIVCTQDAMHVGPAVALARKGYHLLLEKPMAPNEADCRAIVEAVEKAGVLLGVCHVMRYTGYTRALKALLDEGAVGQIVSVQHLEPVHYWHQAHSFVRGHWRNSRQSSSMLLAKSCHDVDWLRYIMGRPCRRVASFGSLFHFRRQAKPAGAGAASRCVDCPIEGQCPYSAVRFYVGRARRGQWGWPVDVLTPERTVEAVAAAVADGPYGRCVYECDNDVVDHQVVNLEFEGGPTASFTMTAFTGEPGSRKTKVFGTHGEIVGDGRMLDVYDFLTDGKRTVDTHAAAGDISGGHGGGDERLMEAFVAAVASGDAGRILSGPAETLESHRMVFAAERARLEGRVVDLAEPS